MTRTANAWSDDVAGPVSKQGRARRPRIAPGRRQLGRQRGEEYKDIVPFQKTALDKVKSGFTDGISLALSQLRSAIKTFKAALVVALVSCVAGIAGAFAAAGTIFGIPIVPVIAAGAVAVCAASLYLGVSTLQSAAASANTQLRQKIDDSSGYPGGRLPSTVLH